MRVDLPDGAWADLADPVKVSERRRRPVVEAVTALTRNADVMSAVNAADEDAAAKAAAGSVGDISHLNDLVVLALVTAWSFGDAITGDALLDLPGDAYNALQAACAPALGDLLPSFEVDPDPKAATGGSSS